MMLFQRYDDRSCAREAGQIRPGLRCGRSATGSTRGEWVKVLLRCIGIVFKERPDVVISTGAAAGCILCLLGKMRGAKVIWIDSITNVERISLSGRMVRHVADLFLVAMARSGQSLQESRICWVVDMILSDCWNTISV